MDFFVTVITTIIPFIFLFALAGVAWWGISFLLTIKKNSFKKIEQNNEIISLLKNRG
ncbi:hypothetical protein [Bacillus haynesii]|uniref:hypothetical protein n=1 Tax=Bacillus haynesii TaxID=1925021 RepID=UPI00228055AC|nr:hypothetical protein [Bacillus haynesii]MCY8002573.1 hypothetical protein [Bacillus haynesii]MCY8348135.1 hypothetical protein [Bacillus haynesii]MCY8559006.1 hypothetical protein [Bacillus haynesii]MCY9265319.1 hypothetical protein [Bacillus haynesii]MEC0722744.1 hypothetical protein [Bacillus haynesii]